MSVKIHDYIIAWVMLLVGLLFSLVAPFVGIPLALLGALMLYGARVKHRRDPVAEARAARMASLERQIKGGRIKGGRP